MAETKEGGVYRVGDGYENAKGERVRAPKEAATPEPFPADFPGAAKLQKAGVKTAADAQGMTREALIALDGIGESTADAILAWEPAE